MKFRDFSIPIVVVVVLTATLVGLISSYFMGNDNTVEETSEEIIKNETGIDVDLSPDSTEHPYL